MVLAFLDLERQRLLRTGWRARSSQLLRLALDLVRASRRIGVGAGFADVTQGAEIVGVVVDQRFQSFETPPEPDVYVSYYQVPQRSGYLYLRTAGEPTALVAAVRREVQSLDPNLPIYDVQTMEQRIGTATARTREIGVRMTLGAHRTDVAALVLRHVAAMVGPGLLLGLSALGARRACCAPCSTRSSRPIPRVRDPRRGYRTGGLRGLCAACNARRTRRSSHRVEVRVTGPAVAARGTSLSTCRQRRA